MKLSFPVQVFCRSKQGFSLVEVVIAIGIVSFAVLAMMGLMTTSMQVLSDSRQAEISRNIYRAVAGKLQNTEYADLPMGDLSLAFDLAGFVAQDDDDTIFKVHVRPQAGADVGGTQLAPAVGRVFEVNIFRAPGGVAMSQEKKIFAAPLIVARREKPQPE